MTTTAAHNPNPSTTPAWFDSSQVALLHKALTKAATEDTEAVLPESEHVETSTFEAYVTLRGTGDLLVQFISPKCTTFADVLPELVETHFGTTDGFKLHVEPAIESFGLLMEGIRLRPLFDRVHVVDNFLALVDRTLTILRES